MIDDDQHFPTVSKLSLTRRTVVAALASSLASPILAQVDPASPVTAGTRIADLPFVGHFAPHDPALIAGGGSYNTVSSGADNGANNCLAGKIWQAARHSTTKQAVNNLLAKIPVIMTLGASNCILAGHGNEGLVETGCGQGNGDWKTQYILTWNEAEWGPELDRIKGKNWVMMYIISCHTGAGEAGADLLFQMARRAGKPIAGRTGFTYCGKNVSFEANSVWQIATPAARPTPIPAPTAHLMLLPPQGWLVPQGEFLRELDPSSVQSVTVRRRLQDGRLDKALISKDRDTSMRLLRSLFAKGPSRLPGEPAALITAYVTVQTRGAAIAVEVYNDRLARFAGTNVAYHTAPDWHAMLDTMTS